MSHDAFGKRTILGPFQILSHPEILIRTCWSLTTFSIFNPFIFIYCIIKKILKNFEIFDDLSIAFVDETQDEPSL